MIHYQFLYIYAIMNTLWYIVINLLANAIWASEGFLFVGLLAFLKNSCRMDNICRKGRNWSQSQLADRLGISYAQIGRYETKEAQPKAEVLKKIADALNSKVEFLVNADTPDKGKAALQDAEVIHYFKEIDILLQENKSSLLRIIAGFIRDVKNKQAYA